MTNFLDELKALLWKYNACIQWTCDESSDTYGITGEKMVLYYSEDGIKKTWEINDGGIEASDIIL